MLVLFCRSLPRENCGGKAGGGCLPGGAENLSIRWAALLLSLGEDGTRRTPQAPALLQCLY